MESTEELTIEDIVNLKSSCSKKVFDNFIEQKYASKAKPADEETKPKKKSKADREFEKVFGCERPKEYKPTIDKRVLSVDKEQPEEQIDEEDRPEEMTAKYRPRKFREIFKVQDSGSVSVPFICF